MAQFQNMIITRAGLDMIAQSQAGGTLIFTKGKLGDGQIGDQSIPDLTDLINAKMSVELSSVTAKTEGHVEVRFIVDNTDLDVGFFVREVGIFAKVNEEGVEQLYGYANAGNYTNYLADKTVPIDSIITKIDLVVGNACNVAFTTDKSLVYVTLEDMENALNAHDAGTDAHEPAFDAHNAADDAHKDFTGATAEAAGKRGFVPAPKAGDQNKALFGNGQYQEVIIKTDIMAGATSSNAGIAGLVPAPAAGTHNKALFGDGQYKDVITLDSEQTISVKKTFRALYLQNTDTQNEGGELKFIYSKNINKTAGLDLFHLDSQNPALRIIDYRIMTDSTRASFYFWLDGSITTLQGKVDIVKASSFGENFKYIRYVSGKQEVWCIGQATTTDPIITLPVSFSSATVLCNDVGVAKTSYSAKWLDSNRVQLYVPSGHGYNLFVVGTGEE